ncbi:MAG: MlaD family protein [Solirubrobacteraceae bacterium]
MRSRVVAAAMGIGLVLVVVLAVRGPASDGGAYRFAAVFDTARGVVPGQQVKIAGAKAGTVEAVDLVAGPKARIVMAIDGDLGPFREDASCAIRPEGLISEHFVMCEPGRSARELPAGAGGLPAVALASTTVPVGLQDVVDVFAAPVADRARLIFTELGLATVARGDDLNEIVRRANPALRDANRLLAILDRQRGVLRRAIDASDEILAGVGERTGDVRGLVSELADLTEETARHDRALTGAVRRLPALLTEIDEGLGEVRDATERAGPFVSTLRRSAPEVVRLSRTLPTFVRSADRALPVLERVAKDARSTLRTLDPVLVQAITTLEPLFPMARDLARLLVSVRDRGGVEGLVKTAYALATDTAMYDNVSHMLAVTVGVAPDCIAAGLLKTSPPRGCSHKYDAEGEGLLPVNQPGCGPQDGSWWPKACTPTLSTLATERRASADERAATRGRDAGGASRRSSARGEGPADPGAAGTAEAARDAMRPFRTWLEDHR